MSLNGALAIASRSLEVFSLGIQVAGQNISNASTPGYVREVLNTETTRPYATSGTLIGTGVNASGVRQRLDTYLEARIYAANTDFSAADIRSNAYQQLQTALQELGEQDLSTSLNDFIAAVNATANQPDDPALRSAVIQQGQRFVTDVQKLRGRLDELRDQQSEQMSGLVGEANSLIQTVNKLNTQITQLEANGLNRNDAGGLRVQRLNALNRLSEIIPIRVQEYPSGSVDIFTNSDYLLLAGHAQTLQTVLEPTSNGVAEVNVQLSLTRSTMTTAAGELGGLIQGRDTILSGFIQQLDKFVGAVTEQFNRIHASGEGLVGFTDVTSTNYVNDTTADLNNAGLPFAPNNGRFELKVQNKQSGETIVTTVPIDLDGTGGDMSLEDLRTALDAIDHVNATITNEGKLRITTDSGYEIRFSNDTSGVLAALGINTFFSGSTSGDLKMNSMIVQDQRLLASGKGGGPADNTNLLQLAQFIDKPVSALNGVSVDQFYTQLIGNTAQSAAAEQALSDGFQNFRDSLKTQREQTSGVSLDEEAIRVMNLQTNYQAAAKIVSTIDQLLNVLLQM
jgi:flagellar hook-associated protein 1